MMLQYLLILSARRDNECALIIAELHGKRKILVKRKVTHKLNSNL